MSASVTILRVLSFAETASRVRLMKESAAPEGMPRALAWSFNSFLRDF